MKSPVLFSLGLTLLSNLHSFVEANTRVPTSAINAPGGLFALAKASRPMWHFGQAMNQRPCYPEAALQSSGERVPPTDPKAWPVANGGSCADPGARIGVNTKGNSFPTYYTTSKCSDDQIRISYNIFFRHDGFTPIGVFGHPYDWERVIVVWNRDPSTDTWYRSGLFQGRHSGHIYEAWNSIQNTVQPENFAEQGAKDKDIAKVYVGWGKHAMFTTRNTGFNDVISQLTDKEFRSNDWFNIPSDDELIDAGRGTAIGDAIAKQAPFGDATSYPGLVQDQACGITGS